MPDLTKKRQLPVFVELGFGIRVEGGETFVGKLDGGRCILFGEELGELSVPVHQREYYSRFSHAALLRDSRA